MNIKGHIILDLGQNSLPWGWNFYVKGKVRGKVGPQTVWCSDETPGLWNKQQQLTQAM